MPTAGSPREDVKSAYLAWGDPLNDPAGAIGQLHFDAVLIESHERTAEVTSHTVEQGAAITDHVRPNPDELLITAFVSNTPVSSPDAQKLPLTLQLDKPQQDTGFPLSGGTSALLDQGLQALGLIDGFPTSITASVYQFETDKDYVQLAYKTLTQLRDKATLVSVVTPKEVYFNLVIRRIGLRRDPGVGTGGAFDIEFQEIRIISSTITDAPLPSTPSGNVMKPVGKKDPNTPPVPKQSVAKHWLAPNSSAF